MVGKLGVNMTPAEKVRENRLRRMAARQKLNLRKSGRRDPRAYDYGVYTLFNEYNRRLWSGRGLDEVERFLTDPRRNGGT